VPAGQSHLAIDLLKKDKAARTGINSKHVRPAWDEDYPPKVFGFFQ
jgi:hypothetical protein